MHVAQWALGSTAVNKASGCDITPVELFTILRVMLSSVAFNMSANLEDPAVAQDWKKSVFIPIPRKVSTKECSNRWIIALISHASQDGGGDSGLENTEELRGHPLPDAS